LRGQRATIGFEGLPQWLLRPAKLTIAQRWLSERRSQNLIIQTSAAFRRIDEYLSEFSGASMVELTSEFIDIIQRKLDADIMKYNEVIEESRIRLGRRLSRRETTRACLKSGARGPSSIRLFVNTFNLAAWLLEEIDGCVVPFRLRIPRAIDDAATSRGIGSADPEKVLSSQQMANLERALTKELRRYEKARTLINNQLSDLKLDTKEKRPNALVNLELYFGLNGLREHTCSEICALRGLAPGSSSEIPRSINRFLSKHLGGDLATKILTLRSQFGNLRAQRKNEELEAGRSYIRGVLEKVDFSFAADLLNIEIYFGLNGRGLHSLPATTKTLQQDSEQNLYPSICKSLAWAVGETKSKRLLRIRGRLVYYLTRAIKAQAVRLQLAVARRMSAVLELPTKPKLKVYTTEGRRIVEVEFRARKTWGDEGISEWVPCVDTFGEIAEDAISVAQKLTMDLRQIAGPDDNEFLFIIPKGNSPDISVRLTTAVLQKYIYTNAKNEDGGILRRYGLDELSNFSFHHIRHTHSTHMIEAGGTIQDVAHYLGHTTINGPTTMAGVFYLAGGTEAMRQRTANALREGAATGMVFDGVARMKIEAMGGDATRASVPPNQLSFEQARQRILSADIVEEIPFEPSEAAKLLQQKVVVNVTRQGGCLLQATSGPCPTANPCAIGILPGGKEPTPGCGCKYLVLLPHSAEQLIADIAIMDAQLVEMVGDEWTMWRSHIETKRDHYRSLLEIAMSLNESSKKNHKAATTNCESS
jgi:hypothetical protein